jgi:hypothetical protein
MIWKESLPDVFALRAATKFLTRIAFVERFEGIMGKLSSELNEERSRLFEWYSNRCCF